MSGSIKFKQKKNVWKHFNLSSVARFIQGRTRTLAGNDSDHWARVPTIIC